MNNFWEIWKIDDVEDQWENREPLAWCEKFVFCNLEPVGQPFLLADT